MKLVMGNISSWSMRAWMCLSVAEIPFEELVIPLGTPAYEKTLANHSKTMLVPVLETDDIKVHDSLAIAEYANELSGGKLLPQDSLKRAECRSLCSELHSGFPNIRSLYPFSWQPDLSSGINPAIQNELQRLTAIWSQAEGHYYYGEPTMVDAFYTVMAYRLFSYNIILDGRAGEYQRQLIEWPLFASLLEKARAWAEFTV